MTIKPHKPTVSAIVEPTASQHAFWIYSGSTSESDPAVLVVRFTLCPIADTECLQRAWELTVSQHDMLRASLNPNKNGEPLLVIRKSVASEIHFLGPDEHPDISISLSKAPVHMLHCRVNGDGSCEFVWHCHHALLDGWSAQLVINDLVENYAGLLVSGEQYKPGQRDYLEVHRKMHHLDDSDSVVFWQNLLRGYQESAVMSSSAIEARNDKIEFHELPLLKPEQTAMLQSLCRQSGVTAATVMQFMWGYAVGKLCNRSDVVIGVAVSGRPPTMPGIDKIAGCFSTVAPSRIKLRASETVESHLKQLQIQLFEAAGHQHLGMMSILEQADPSCGNRLFDSLLVIENLPRQNVSDEPHRPLVSHYKSGVVSSYPLTLTLIPGEQWVLRCDYRSDKFSLTWVNTLADYLVMVAASMLQNWRTPLVSVGEVSESLLPSHPNKGILTARNSTGMTRDKLFESLDGPINNTELEILALWEEVLNIRPLSMGSRFFDVGGNSLLAVKLIQKVSSNLDRQIPAALFLENPTPRQCAQRVLLPGEEPPFIPSLFPLKPARTPSKATLYCLHAGGGHAMFYREFARNLPDDIACYALQPKGIDGIEPPITNISEMATQYLNEIKTLQPTGPYHLLCYCFSGALMLEMAKQLQQKNEVIGQLIVADAPAPIPATHLMSKFGWGAFIVYELAVQGRWDLLWKAAKPKIRKRIGVNHQSNQKDERKFKTLAAVQQACVTSFKGYRATTTDLQLTFLNAGSENPESSQAVYMRQWRILAPNSVDYPLVGDHRYLFDLPDVKETASVVSDILDVPVTGVGDINEPEVLGMMSEKIPL